MSSLSDFAENALIGHTFGGSAYTPAATVYLALLSASATDSGTGATISEANYTSYARAAITFGAAASRQIAQSGQVSFPKCTGGSGTYGFYAILDSATLGAGNVLAHGTITTPINVVANNTPSVASGQTVISVAAGGGASGAGISTYLANKWLDLMFRNQAYAQPSKYACLTTATATDASTGSTISEPGGNYARILVSSWAAVSAGATSNSGTITFNLPTVGYSLVGTALADATSAGNLLAYDNSSVVDQAVNINDPVSFAAGGFAVSLS